MNSFCCFCLFVISAQCLANKDIANEGYVGSDDIYGFIEAELQDFNMFKAVGQWTLRANTNTTRTSRLNINLHNDMVIVEGLKKDQLIHKWHFTHHKESRRIEGTDNGQKSLFYFLYQDHNIIVYFTVKPDNTKKLMAFTRTGSHVTDDCIRNVIEKLLRQSGVKRMTEQFMPTLSFKPQQTTTGHEIEFPIRDAELIDADFPSGVGNWSIRYLSEKVNPFDEHHLGVNANQLLIHSYVKGQLKGTSVANYIKGSRVIKALIFSEKFASCKYGIVYQDNDLSIQVIYLEDIPQKPILQILSRTKIPFNPEYAKKVVNNQLLFSRDIRRQIKDLVPKLVFN